MGTRGASVSSYKNWTRFTFREKQFLGLNVNKLVGLNVYVNVNTLGEWIDVTLWCVFCDSRKSRRRPYRTYFFYLGRLWNLHYFQIINGHNDNDDVLKSNYNFPNISPWHGEGGRIV